MKRPEVDALPCGEWFSEKTYNYLAAALFIIPLLDLIAAICAEADVFEGKISVAAILFSLPTEAYDSIFTILAIFILNRVRIGMSSFYRQFEGLWQAIFIVLTVSVAINLISIFDESGTILSDLIYFIVFASFGILGIRLANHIIKSYAGMLQTFGKRLKRASIVAAVGGLGISLALIIRGSDASEGFDIFIGALALIIVIAYFITFISLLLCSLNLLNNGAKKGWEDDTDMPAGYGSPEEDEESSEPLESTSPAQSHLRSVASQVGEKTKSFLTKKTLIALSLIAVAAAGGAIVWNVIDNSDLESIFAKVDIPTITPQEAVAKGSISLCGSSVYKYDAYDDEGNKAGTNYGAHFNTLELEFNRYRQNERGIVVQAYLTHSSELGDMAQHEYGIGFLKDKTLTIYHGGSTIGYSNVINYDSSISLASIDYDDSYSLEELIEDLDSGNARIMLQAKIDNMAHFSCRMEDGSESADFYDQETWRKIAEDTPVSTYAASNGLTIKTKLFRAPKNANIKAIVDGIISNVPSSMPAYENAGLYTALTNNKRFKLDSFAEGCDFNNATVKWSKERLVIDETDPYYGRNEIVLDLRAWAQ